MIPCRQELIKIVIEMGIETEIGIDGEEDGATLAANISGIDVYGADVVKQKENAAEEEEDNPDI